MILQVSYSFPQSQAKMKIQSKMHLKVNRTKSMAGKGNKCYQISPSIYIFIYIYIYIYIFFCTNRK